MCDRQTLTNFHTDITNALLYMLHRPIVNIKTHTNVYIPQTNEIPLHIKSYIQHTQSKTFIFSDDINNKLFTVHFTTFIDNAYSKSKLTEMFRQMCVWMYMLNTTSHSGCNPATMTSYIYLTPSVRKFYPPYKTTLGQYNVNGGYTYVCITDGHIVIYRKEEWFKVFIHETFHAYGMDFATHGRIKSCNNMLQLTFAGIPMNNVQIFEAYAEIWARLVYIMLRDYVTNANRFIKYVEKSIKQEQLFSMIQTVKILSYMDLTYDGIFDSNSLVKYKETTNIFAYYIVVGILLNSCDSFLQLCLECNKTKIYKINKPNKIYQTKFCKFIINHCNDTNILKRIKTAENKFTNGTLTEFLSLRMMSK